MTALCDNIDRLFNQLTIQEIICICGEFLTSTGGTKHLLDLMFSLDMYPVITKQTIIWKVSATLIDNIFTTFNSDITSGLLVIDISDHLPVFAICKCDSNLHVNYNMGDTVLSTIVKENDSEVTINANMKVSEPCGIATSKGTQIFGLIRRNITYKEKELIIPLYKAIVRPHLEYCIQALRPGYIYIRLNEYRGEQ